MKSVCPERETWQQFVDGQTTEKDHREDLDEHLKVCPECQSLIGQLRKSQDLAVIQNEVETQQYQWTPLQENPTWNQSSWANLLPNDLDPVGPDRDFVPSIPGLIDLQEIGRGGVGVVYSAIEEDLKRPVAVKVLGVKTQLSNAARERALSEAMILARIQHPQVVQIFRSGEIDGLPYLVMELIPGGSLASWIQNGVVPPRLAAQIVRDLAEAVSEVHALGIIHQDLKPENVLLLPAKVTPGFIPKLADFGLAHVEARGNLGFKETGTIMGTPCYMAPEQTGLKPELGWVGPATDVHGLGSILYALLTQRPPYEGLTPLVSMRFCSEGKYRPIQTLRKGIPGDLRFIVETCLQTEPRARYRSAGLLADDLERFLQGRPIKARPTTSLESLWKFFRRHPLTSMLAFLLFLSLSSLLVGSFFSYRTLKKNNQEMTETKIQLQKALSSLSNDVVERMIQRGQALNEADREFLSRVRRQYHQWPLEPDPIAARIVRGEALSRLGHLFYRVDQNDDSLECHLEALAECELAELLHPIASQQDKLNKLIINTQISLHETYFRLGRMEDAIAEARKGIEEVESRIPTGSPDRFKVLWFYEALANDFRLQKKEDEWNQVSRIAIPLARQYHEQYPGEFEACDTHLRVLFNIGIGFLTYNQIDNVQETFQTLYCHAGNAATQFPEKWHYFRVYELQALSGLIDSANQNNHPEISLEIIQDKIESCKTALKQAPGDDQLSDTLIEIAVQYFNILRKIGRSRKAIPLMTQAMLVGKNREQAEPAVYDRSRNLFQVQLASCELFLEIDRPDISLEIAQQMEVASQSWSRIHGRKEEINNSLKNALAIQVASLSALGQHQDAANKLEVLIEMEEGDDYYFDLIKLSRLLLDAGDRIKARLAAEKAAKHDKTAIEATEILNSMDRK